MDHLLYLMFRCDFDVMKNLENLEELGELNTAFNAIPALRCNASGPAGQVPSDSPRGTGTAVVVDVILIHISFEGVVVYNLYAYEHI